MGSILALAEGMRTFGLLIALLVATPLAQTQTDQKPVVPEGTISRQDAPDRDDNINARYIVEHADITRGARGRADTGAARRPACARRPAP